jgi:hypothetical protein
VDELQRSVDTPCKNARVTTAIFVILALVAVGLVVDALFRLRKWLQRPPPPSGHPPENPLDE